MHKLVALTILALLVHPDARAQGDQVKVHIKAVLVSRDLNQKPVPHLNLQFADGSPSGERVIAKTNLDGVAELGLKPGKYRLLCSDGVEFEGHRYIWDIEISVSGERQTVELSNDNATLTATAPVAPSRKVDELTTLFQKLENSVVTVWSEIGSGTGFIVEKNGLILTNQHVIGPSEMISAV